jgi:hypothetical protein
MVLLEVQGQEQGKTLKKLKADLLIPFVDLAHLGEVDPVQRDLLFFAFLCLDGNPADDVVLRWVYFDDSTSLESRSSRDAMMAFEFLEKDPVAQFKLNILRALARKTVC